MKILPFPWRCNHCGKKAVVPSTIVYRFGELLIEELVIPICKECGERCYTDEVFEQIKVAKIINLAHPIRDDEL